MFRALFFVLLVTAQMTALSETTAVPVARPASPNYTNTASSRRQVSSEADPMVIEPSWWKANMYSYSIGYETGSNSTGVLGQNVMTGGLWLSDKFGFDLFLGYTKGANGSTTSVSNETNIISTPSTLTVLTQYSGTNSGSNIAIATNVKYRVLQTDWFQFNIGMMVAFIPSSSADYSTGSKREVYADVTNTGNKTVTETGLGSVKVASSSQIIVGPRLGSEFYIKWFPHLAIGFSTGVVTTLSGETTTTTDSSNKTYVVTNGTPATPTVNTSTHTVDTTKLGTTGTTFGLGGTSFSLLGSFSIRYVW